MSYKYQVLLRSVVVVSLMLLAACGHDSQTLETLLSSSPERHLVIESSDNLRSYWPLMLHDGVKFRMWHMRDHGDGTNDVVYRESANALAWSEGQVVLNLQGFVTEIASNDGVLYLGFFEVSSPGASIATSTDGIHWSKQLVIPQQSSLMGPWDIIDLLFLKDGQLAIFAKGWDGGSVDGKNSTPGSGLRVTNVWVPGDSTYRMDNTVLKATLAEGALEFYGMSPFYFNNKLYGAVRTLHDDVEKGVGETTLATSEDGVNWDRTDSVLLSRGSAGEFDGAMAWVSSAVQIGDSLYLAYSGYDLGHKIGTRQVGIAILK